MLALEQAVLNEAVAFLLALRGFDAVRAGWEYASFAIGAGHRRQGHAQMRRYGPGSMLKCGGTVQGACS